MAEIQDICALMLAVWKDKASKADMERLKLAHNQIVCADADSRRTKMRSVILHMANLKTCLRRFTITYQTLAAKNGSIPAIEEYIKEVQNKIIQDSQIKNHMNL